jgi:predicted DNA-binding protein with PD1-like motif
MKADARLPRLMVCAAALLAAIVSRAPLLAAEAAAPARRLVDRVAPGQPVPSPLTFATQFERVVIVRLTYGSDLLEGLKRAVAEEKIASAVVLNGLGSLKSYHVHSVGNTVFPSTDVFMKGEGPFDLTAVSGYVVAGRVHAHITFSNEHAALGGHLEPGTTAFTFAIITLGVLPDAVDLSRLDDKDWR